MHLRTLRAAAVAALATALVALTAAPASAQLVGWPDSSTSTGVTAGSPATVQAPGSGPLGSLTAQYTPTTVVQYHAAGTVQVPVYRTDPVYDWVAQYAWVPTYGPGDVYGWIPDYTPTSVYKAAPVYGWVQHYTTVTNYWWADDGGYPQINWAGRSYNCSYQKIPTGTPDIQQWSGWGGCYLTGNAEGDVGFARYTYTYMWAGRGSAPRRTGSTTTANLNATCDDYSPFWETHPSNGTGWYYECYRYNTSYYHRHLDSSTSTVADGAPRWEQVGTQQVLDHYDMVQTGSHWGVVATGQVQTGWGWQFTGYAWQQTGTQQVIDHYDTQTVAAGTTTVVNQTFSLSCAGTGGSTALGSVNAPQAPRSTMTLQVNAGIARVLEDGVSILSAVLPAGCQRNQPLRPM